MVCNAVGEITVQEVLQGEAHLNGNRRFAKHWPACWNAYDEQDIPMFPQLGAQPMSTSFRQEPVAGERPSLECYDDEHVAFVP